MRRVLLFLFLLGLTGAAFGQVQQVSTQFGPVQGAKNGNVVQFLGIPFATPPVGALRWKAPLPPASWTQPLSAEAFKPACPQKQFEQGDTVGTMIGNEDCLYLNVWTPQTGAGTRAVMVFIHGGGNQQGSANQIRSNTYMYFGKNLAERGDVVVVTIQYRLGPLGFLVHPGLEKEQAQPRSGNYAVLDQILALTWVKNNIAAFGGDPNNVMIFGESAGGVNVGNLLVSPLAAGLFHKAAIQSATPIMGEYAEAKERGVDYVDGYIPQGGDSAKIAYMRSLPPDSLIKNLTSPLAGGLVQMDWRPVLDGYVFMDYPETTFRSGKFNKAPLIIGSNAEEMSLSVPPTVVPLMVTSLIKTAVPADLQALALQLYPPGANNDEAWASMVGLLTDAQFTVTTRRTAQCVSENQTLPVWRYLVSHAQAGLLEKYGAYHGIELFYLFNTWEETPLAKGPLFRDEDKAMQSHMLKYWTNFAKTGNPNGQGLVSWPEYHAPADCYLTISANPDGTRCGLRDAECDLWDQAVGFTGCLVTDVKTIGAGQTPLLYPNPTSGTLQFEPALQADARIRVYNQQGQLCLQAQGNTALHLGHLPKGMYFLRISGEGLEVLAKVVKQ
ncbi:MAG: carboxylesterase family protein [Haliscomenobacter sp.]|nr:carboxylesterase family protein [Haliscomenobacter sp.]